MSSYFWRESRLYSQDGTVSVRHEDGSSESIQSVPDVPDLSEPGPAKKAQLHQDTRVDKEASF